LESVKLPAAWAAAGGQHLPRVCARHGEPAVLGRKVALLSKPAPWTYLLLLAGVLPYAIAVMATRKTVNAPAWPWCPQCVADRKRKLGIGIGIMVPSFLLTYALVFAGQDALGEIAGIGGLVFIVTGFAGAFIAVRGGANLISGANVSRDGRWIEVPKAHERFAAEVRPPEVATVPQYESQQTPRPAL
jgi:hypothetical protein